MAQAENNVQLYKALKQCVSHYFEENNSSRFANKLFWVKAVFYFLLPVAGYFLLLFFSAGSLLLVFTGYFLLNAGSTLLVVNVAHDASHQCLSKHKSVNHLLSFLWNVMGISAYLWELQHHRSHHNHTGIPHRDVDVDENFWIRYNPTHRYRWYFKYQHLYAPFLYLLFGVFVVFVKDFVMLYSGRLKPFGADKLPRFFFVRLVLMKLVYVFIVLIIPILVLPFAGWQLLLIYLLTLSVSSGSMLVVLVIPHINREAVTAEEELVIHNQDEWTLHQLHANIDSSSESKWLSWLLGGLNTHLIHHLFPNICHIHYPSLTKRLQQTLKEKDIAYTQRSFAKAVADHFRFLQQMGKAPS